jgi:type IV pilus assembly protein PilF
MIRSTVVVLVIVLFASACSSGPRLSDADRIEAARVNAQLGVDYLRKGLLDEAVAKLEKSVDLNPDSANAQAALALAYSQAGRVDRADRAFRRALDADPNSPEVRNNYGVFLCQQGKPAEAEKHFLEAARHPRYSTPEAAWTNAGICLLKSSPDKAENYFRQALERNREFPDALVQMAWICYRQQDYWRARAFLQRYDSVAPASATTLWIGVQTARALGHRDEAQQLERRLVSEFPESEQAASLRQKPNESLR